MKSIEVKGGEGKGSEEKGVEGVRRCAALQTIDMSASRSVGQSILSFTPRVSERSVR